MLYETFPGYAGTDCGVFFWGVFAMDKPKVMVMLAPGFEEGETVTILDIVRRGGFAADSVRYVADVVVRDGKMIASRAPGGLCRSLLLWLMHWEATARRSGNPFCMTK
ncbi:hypothetical protein NB646_04855 [Oxalobacter aliiformigenes]|uniref:Uncharacterized protein n=1 Tax=Oxalobacter aliiformigenes TaxID=2946593 RepID=A0A9E9LF28_9BURK|nr:hypothetical protein [Oxalobacter aliiformigenes]WAV92048.1 hypothetical protein NB646_04855 [Oxalobacter aliiformigenes]